MDTHIKVLGWLHLVVGGIACLSTLGLGLLFFGMGALGGAAALSEGDAESAIAAFGILGTIGVMVAGCAAIVSLPGMVAGWGLLTRAKWAPILAIVVSLFHVLNFPFGTALAVYTFWVCLSKEGQAELGFKVA